MIILKKTLSNLKRSLALTLLVAMIVAIVASVSACAPFLSNSQGRTVFAMDTVIELTVYSSKDASKLLDSCESLICDIEDSVSKTKANSDVYRLNATGSAVCSDVTLALINESIKFSLATQRAFDITLAPLIEFWNSLDGQPSLPNDSEFTSLLTNTGSDNIKVQDKLVTLQNGVKIDLGGIAKGYAAQAVVDLIEKNSEEYGVSGGLLSFGGAVSVFGKKPNGSAYKIALRDPNDVSRSIGYVTLEGNGHVSVSGDYERYVTVGGVRYHHIIDASTGFPARSGVKSVSVISADGALSDALSTALFVMGHERALALYEAKIFDFEAVFILDDGTVMQTPNANFTEYEK